MGITRYTAYVIQGNDDIRCGAEMGADGMWIGTISHFKDGHPHALLLSSNPVFKSESEAISTMESVVKEIRAIDLSCGETVTT